MSERRKGKREKGHKEGGRRKEEEEVLLRRRGRDGKMGGEIDREQGGRLGEVEWHIKRKRKRKRKRKVNNICIPCYSSTNAFTRTH